MGEPAVLTKMIDVHEAQTRLEELLAMLFEGTEIILAQNNKPLARLTPVASPTMPRIAGLHAGAVWMSEDFSEPLPEAFWTGNV
jgi:antitoxin (DNA-binding transcriptional repressor) of toxin-antitoxin stability system